MKPFVMFLGVRCGLLNYRWFRAVGTWLVRMTGAWK